MNLPYNPFLCGPDAETYIQPGDRLVTIPADLVPTDRFGFNRLAFEPEFRDDADLFFAAANWLGYRAVSMGETDGFEGDGQRIRNLVDDNGDIRLIYSRQARNAGIDIRA
ncbi:MAG: hypothetical protein ACXWLH_04940 [Candidatus Saccharimonadales bacterium]